MLPFSLVQKLYAAHFPYSWITWEGKLWEDPENQPNLGELVRECLRAGEFKLVCYPHGYFIQRPAGWDSKIQKTPEESLTHYWLSLSHPNQPRTAEHVDVPTEI